MIRQSLELESDSADCLRTRALPAPRERLHRTTPCAGVRDHAVTGDRFRDINRAIPAKRLEQTLDTAMLVSKHDLQREHFLTMSLKTEMTRLDDSCVHRPDGDFVHLVTAYSTESMCPRWTLARQPAGRSVIGPVASHWIQVGMPNRSHTTLLGDLALEPRGLPTTKAERCIFARDERAEYRELATLIVTDHAGYAHAIAPFRHAEQRDNPPSGETRILEDSPCF